ncbi:Fur-regulated basic protein FbpA [Aquibacillus albus]|uniref:Fur-regulated basic protein FbpA n=1 Tax=Aquibacillus albus TaxID=1168171 RepID=A0ABS2N3B3_9BACI|nr:Fur-regulated basic protein FbpA [Aquibacillus albus]MBM7572599.1 hypothetical protein [Aquibacillus albus]
MSYLRKAVNQQKSLLIKKLIQAGAYQPTDHSIYEKTITELVDEYKKSKASKQNNAV